eukprot:CAMPEP_0114542942 /NCGR_PEP_ID=MMETSP0114-20121206/2095_1 /TAXON_ID=31324 /ORGANISM="Goniomonas sp, Strain m" /LENGTH=1081 /DNA_ID=CAMNT_0001727255 /DNA_START=493 /DNA_END=3736 /DNA_ORIENTATION=+
MCTQLVAHKSLHDFISATVSIVVHKWSGSSALKKELFGRVVTFWTALINWNFVSSEDYTRLRGLISSHEHLKETLRELAVRSRRREPGNVDLLGVLADDDAFRARLFSKPFADVAESLLGVLFQLASQSISRNLADESGLDALEVLSVLAATPQGLSTLLANHSKQLQLLFAEFVAKYGTICAMIGTERGSEAELCLRQFYKLYGNLNDADGVFLDCLWRNHNELSGWEKFDQHLQHFELLSCLKNAGSGFEGDHLVFRRMYDAWRCKAIAAGAPVSRPVATTRKEDSRSLAEPASTIPAPSVETLSSLGPFKLPFSLALLPCFSQILSEPVASPDSALQVDFEFPKVDTISESDHDAVATHLCSASVGKRGRARGRARLVPLSLSARSKGSSTALVVDTDSRPDRNIVSSASAASDDLRLVRKRGPSRPFKKTRGRTPLSTAPVSPDSTSLPMPVPTKPQTRSRQQVESADVPVAGSDSEMESAPRQQVESASADVPVAGLDSGHSMESVPRQQVECADVPVAGLDSEHPTESQQAGSADVPVAGSDSVMESAPRQQVESADDSEHSESAPRQQVGSADVPVAGSDSESPPVTAAPNAAQSSPAGETPKQTSPPNVAATDKTSLIAAQAPGDQTQVSPAASAAQAARPEVSESPDGVEPSPPKAPSPPKLPSCYSTLRVSSQSVATVPKSIESPRVPSPRALKEFLASYQPRSIMESELDLTQHAEHRLAAIATRQDSLADGSHHSGLVVGGSSNEPPEPALDPERGHITLHLASSAPLTFAKRSLHGDRALPAPKSPEFIDPGIWGSESDSDEDLNKRRQIEARSRPCLPPGVPMATRQPGRRPEKIFSDDDSASDSDLPIVFSDDDDDDDEGEVYDTDPGPDDSEFDDGIQNLLELAASSVAELRAKDTVVSKPLQPPRPLGRPRRKDPPPAPAGPPAQKKDSGYIFQEPDVGFTICDSPFTGRRKQTADKHGGSLGDRHGREGARAADDSGDPNDNTEAVEHSGPPSFRPSAPALPLSASLPPTHPVHGRHSSTSTPQPFHSTTSASQPFHSATASASQPFHSAAAAAQPGAPAGSL